MLIQSHTKNYDSTYLISALAYYLHTQFCGNFRICSQSLLTWNRSTSFYGRRYSVEMGLRWRTLRPISELFIIIQTSESIWSSTTNYHSLCHQCCLIHYISKYDNYEPITIHLELSGTVNPKQANKRTFRIRSKHNITLHKQKTASLSTSLP